MRLTADRIRLLKVARVEYAQTQDPDALRLMADALPDAIEEIERTLDGNNETRTRPSSSLPPGRRD